MADLLLLLLFHFSTIPLFQVCGKTHFLTDTDYFSPVAKL
jgi:hypothetical protein